VSSVKSKLGEGLYRATGAIQCRAGLVALLALVLSLGLLGYSVTHLGVNTATADMFDRDLPWFQDFSEFRADFKALDDSVLLVVEGQIPEQVDWVQRQLLERLRSRGDGFGLVVALEAEPFFRQNGLLFMAPEELDALGDRLTQMQPLIGRLRQEPHLAGFLSLLSDRLNADPEASSEELDEVVERLTRVFDEARQGEPQPISWQLLLDQDAEAQALYRRTLLLAPELDFTAGEPRKRLLGELRDLARSLPPVQSEAVRVRLTGSLALQQEELDSVSQGIIQGALITLVLVIAILWATFRSLRLFAASLLTLLSGLSVTAAFATLAIGHLNLISVAFAILYIGLGIDFAIHYCLRYRELLSAGREHDQAVREASRYLGSSLVLCAITSSVGFFAFVPTAFTGVAELGLIAGFGMFASLGASLVLLPALIHLFGPPRRPLHQQTPLFFARAGELAHRHQWGVRLGVLVLGLLAAALASQARFDSNPLNLRDPDSESVQAYRDLLRDPDTAPLTLSVLTEPAEARALASRLKELSTVSEVRWLERFVPEDQSDKLLLLDELSLIIGSPEPIELAAPEAGRDLSAVRDLVPRLLNSPMTAERQLGRAMQTWLAALPDEPAADQAATAELSEAALGLFPPTWNRIARGFDAQAFGSGDLPSSFRDLWVAGDGRLRLEVLPEQPLIDMSQIEAFVSSVAVLAPSATGLPAVQYYGGQTVVAAFLQALVTALVCVSLLLLVLLGSVRRSIAVVVPLLLAALITAAGTVVLALPFNFANVITLPLLLGVGVDNGIHMAHRHEADGGHDGLMGSSTARAILFSTLTTVVSFGSLAFSQHPGTASMGMLLSLGMLVSLFAALIVVPALLPKQSSGVKG